MRGGSSTAYLDVGGSGTARFYGSLDTTTLGGAGFASQHSRGIIDLDLSAYDGIVIAVKGSTDGKRYALTLKDCILPTRDDGREQSTISWQAEFVPRSAGPVFLSWQAFKPTYRGRDKPDATPLDLAGIKRVGLMMRRYVCILSVPRQIFWSFRSNDRPSCPFLQLFRQAIWCLLAGD